MTARTPKLSVGLVRRMIVANLAQPVPEVIQTALHILIDGLDSCGALLATIDNDTFEIIDAVQTRGPAIERGMVMPLHESFAAEPGEPLSVRDARSQLPYRDLSMRRRLGIVSYLGVPIRFSYGRVFGTLAAIGDAPRTFSENDQDLVMVIGALIGARIEANEGQPARTPAGTAGVPRPVVRLATDELGEPLAILRGYADMLSRNEIPAVQLALVTKRVAMQAATLVRIVDQMLLLSRLPLELNFTVRVSLGPLAQGTAGKLREDMEAAAMELRVQLDAAGEVWGDAVLLAAALEEMLQNVLRHAPTATVVQLRVRQSARDRFQLIVKDNGPGISADHLAELFAPLAPGSMPSGVPRPGAGLGLYLVRQVAQAHGGSAWANSVEGKGTTFYLELPAASPDGAAARAPHPIAQTSA